MAADRTETTTEDMNHLYSCSQWCKRMSPELVFDYHSNLAFTVCNKVKQSLCCELDVSYGSSEREKYDIFTDYSTPQDAPVVVYIHGGYWQLCTKEYGSFFAELIVKGGAVFVSVDYDLCPHVSMTHIVHQVQRALDSIHQMALSRGSSRMYMVGHSAGAHLAVMSMLSTQSNYPLVAGFLLLSGVYDLRPMLQTKYDDVLKMTREEAWSLSPMNDDNVRALHQKYPQTPVLVVVGEFDSPAFIQQSRDYHEALKAAGQNVDIEFIAGVDHFDLVERLSNDPGYSLSQMLTTFITGKPRNLE